MQKLQKKRGSYERIVFSSFEPTDWPTNKSTKLNSLQTLCLDGCVDGDNGRLIDFG